MAVPRLAARDGFTVDLMVEVVRDGLASATPERVVSGRETIEVARVRITEAGWKALKAAIGVPAAASEKDPPAVGRILMSRQAPDGEAVCCGEDGVLSCSPSDYSF